MLHSVLDHHSTQTALVKVSDFLLRGSGNRAGFYNVLRDHRAAFGTGGSVMETGAPAGHWN